jgi:hypothetical protein
MNQINDADPPMDVNGALESLRATPSRDPARVAAGRAAMLAQAQTAHRRQRVALFSARLRRWRALFAVGAALLTGGAGAVYASQESLPDSPLYAIKLVSEDVRLALAPGADEQRALLQSFAERRRTELSTTSDSTKVERARSRLAEHEAALELINSTQLSATPTTAPRSEQLSLPNLTATATSAPPTETPLPQATIEIAMPIATDTSQPQTGSPEPIETAMPIPQPQITSVATVVTTKEALRTRVATRISPPVTAVIATREAFATQIAPTREAIKTQIAPTREALATQIAPTREALEATREAIKTQIAPTREALEATREAIKTQIAPTREALATQIAPTREALEATREAIKTQIAPTAESIQATITALPNLRATAAAIVSTPPPAPTTAITQPTLELPPQPIPEPAPTTPVTSPPEQPQPTPAPPRRRRP